jgi:hypothetical protein
LLTPAQAEEEGELGAEGRIFSGIYSMISKIKQIGEPAASPDLVESELRQSALEVEDEAILDRICRPCSVISDPDTAYESELQRRRYLAEGKKTTTTRHLLVDSPAFDVGIVPFRDEEVSAEPFQHSAHSI